jgi:hypothetical protein
MRQSGRDELRKPVDLHHDHETREETMPDVDLERDATRGVHVVIQRTGSGSLKQIKLCGVILVPPHAKATNEGGIYVLSSQLNSTAILC